MGIQQHSDWFREARLGMFIHWGIYALEGRGEWARFSGPEHGGRPEEFNPRNFHPEFWAECAWNAGMRYLVFTTKHHDGFCMFDSHYTDYKVTNTPFGKDVTAMVADAFRERGFRIGFYHSLIDWHHPDYLPDRNDPRGKNGETEFPSVRPGVYQKYLYDSVEQLMTEYGRIDLLFWDYCSPWKNPDYFDPDPLLAMIRSHQPEILINDRMTFNRTAEYAYTGDYFTPECTIPSQPPGSRWETCVTTNSSWGYRSGDPVRKPAEAFIAGVVGCVSNGGNLLMNFGPDADGNLPDHGIRVMHELGEWIRINGEAVYGCGPSDFRAGPLTLLTQNGERVYLYFPVAPMGHVMLPNLRDKACRAVLLRTGEEQNLSSWGLVYSPLNEIRLIPTPSVRAHDVIRIDLGRPGRTVEFQDGSAK